MAITQVRSGWLSSITRNGTWNIAGMPINIQVPTVVPMRDGQPQLAEPEPGCLQRRIGWRGCTSFPEEHDQAVDLKNQNCGHAGIQSQKRVADLAAQAAAAGQQADHPAARLRMPSPSSTVLVLISKATPHSPEGIRTTSAWKLGVSPSWVITGTPFKSMRYQPLA